MFRIDGHPDYVIDEEGVVRQIVWVDTPNGEKRTKRVVPEVDGVVELDGIPYQVEQLTHSGLTSDSWLTSVQDHTFSSLSSKEKEDIYTLLGIKG